MPQAETFINDLRAEVTRFRQALRNLRGLRRDWDDLGGQAFIDPFFVTTAPDPENPGQTINVPRTDLGFTAADVAAVFESVAAVDARLAEGHGTNFAKVRT